MVDVIGGSSAGSQSDLEAALAAYTTYADWEEYRESNATTAVVRARSFVTACRRLLVLLPKVSTTRQRTHAEFDPAEIRRQLEHAQRYLAIAGSTAFSRPTQQIDLQNFRD